MEGLQVRFSYCWLLLATIGKNRPRSINNQKFWLIVWGGTCRRSLDAPGYSQLLLALLLLLAAPGCSWVLLDAPGCSWVLLAASGCSWLLLAAPGCSWLLLVAPGCFWLLPDTFSSQVAVLGTSSAQLAEWFLSHKANGPHHGEPRVYP